MNATLLPSSGQANPPARKDHLGALATASAWAVILLMIVPLDFDYSGAGSAEGNPASRVLWLVVLAAGWGVLFARSRMSARVLRQTNVFFLVFLVLAICSTLWSIDPATTFKRIVRLVIQSGAFFALAVAGWRPRRFQHVIRPVLTLLLAGSIIFGLARPDLAIHRETSPELLGAWHGLAVHKNGLGLLAAVGTLLWVQAFLSTDAGRLRAIAGAAIAFTCLILSRSSTCLMATVLSCLALTMLVKTPKSMSRGIRYFAIALTLVILLYSMALLKIVPGLELLLAPIPMITGKDLSFTGRTEIWALVLEHIQRRPLLGSGYGAYWVVGARPTPDQESYSIMGALNGFYPGNSHNGYLDVLNDLGAIGLLCLLGYLIVFLRQSLRLCGTDRQQGALYLALLLQQAIINLSEARFFNNTIFVDFALMSFATTCLARDLLEARIPARPAPVPAPRHLAPGRAPKPPPSRLLVRPRQR